MVVIDMSTFAKPAYVCKQCGPTDQTDEEHTATHHTFPPVQDSSVAYESRTIVADAQRAAMMREPIAKACFWRPCTRQYDLWVATYEAARAKS